MFIGMLGLQLWLKRGFALLMAGTLVGTGLVAPWLEREPAARLALESRHDEHCAPAHDHAVCVQLQQARALPEWIPATLPDASFSTEETLAVPAGVIGFLPTGLKPARAPPHV